MNKNKLALVLCSGLVLTSVLLAPADAKKWTVTQREEKLSREIESAFKGNQLTLKEAQSMRGDVADITAKQEKMKQKNGGKLSYADETQLEKDLNKLSVKIQKKVLEKRVQ